MEGRKSVGNCRACQSVQEIVSINQQMIHEQIRLIKQLSDENSLLKDRNQQLKKQNKQLLDGKEGKEGERSEEGVQTEWAFEGQAAGGMELRVSTRVNIQEGRRKDSSISGISKENLQELVPLHSISKNEEYFSRKRKNSFEEEQCSGSWLKIIEPHHDILPAKLREKTVPFVRKGVPHQIRHIIWPGICEDPLLLTDALYCELEERKGLGWVSKEVRSQIEKDLKRSLSGRGISERVGLDVGEVLQLFHLLRPDVSYVQGMTYPIIVLTLVVGKVKALRMFSNLVIANPFFRKLYTFEPHFVQTLARSFQMLLFDFHYDIADHLSKLKVDAQMFLVEWFYTVFSRCLSFEGTLKFWDQLLYFGEVVLFRMALAIFELVKPHIMEANYQDTIGLIQGFGSYVREDKLLDLLVHHKLSEDKLQRSLDKALRALQVKQSI